MKKQILWIWALLLPMLAIAQTEGYNPDNPPQPNWPEDKTLYDIVCEAIPDGTGSFGSDANSQSVAGKKVSIYASDHDGCYFQCWKDTEGNVLTTERTYSFTMPAHNVRFYAIYIYSPDSPDNPVHVWQYMLSLKCEPEVAATFNFKDQKVDEGSTQDLYAYPNSGFVFKHWKDEQGNIVGENASLRFLMPSHATTLTAYFDYDPAGPINPATNAWDVLTGEMVIDYFQAGRLTETMNYMVGNSDDREKVTSLTVDGVMNQYDWSFANYYGKLTYIDLSRVDGIGEVPSYAFDKKLPDLVEIELPACISRIGDYAFRECTSLTTIDCYAVVPPALGRDVWPKDIEPLTVFVPEESIDLYKAAEGWSAFNILPLKNKICAMQVSLPGYCADGRYQDLQLVAVNQKNGQKLKYDIREKLVFDFPDLVRGTKWKVYVLNSYGQNVGESEEITIDKDVVTYQLTNVKPVANVTLLFNKRSENVAEALTALFYHWTDEEGRVLAENENVMTNVVVGTKFTIDFAYNPDGSKTSPFWIRYELPATQEYTMQEGSNTVNVPIKDIPVVTLTGKVVDAMSGLPVKARIQYRPLSPWGEYYNIQSYITTQVGDDGAFTLGVSKVAGKLFVTEENHVAYTREMTAADLSGGDLGTIVLKVHEGAVVNVSGMLRHAAKDGATPQVKVAFKALENSSYTLFNKTKDMAITNFNARHANQRIDIYDGVEDGDVIEVTATYNGTPQLFAPTTATGTVKDSQVAIAFEFVEQGGMDARYLVTDNSGVVGILYDSKGALVESKEYSYFAPKQETGYNHVEFSNLPAGDYTLITMGKSDFFCSFYSMANLSDVGLKEGSDYVKNLVTIADGRTLELRNVIVPLFDESQYYYTGTNTQFAINKSNTVVGNYLTLSSRIDFNKEVRDRVSDVELLYTLPKECQFVNGSVMRGRELTQFYQVNTTASGKELIVQPGDDYTERVKYCIIPMERGNFAVNAFVRFKLDGRTIVQPIGTANYTSTDLTLWTPKLISKPDLFVNGNAPGNADITVYDGTEVIGTTKALADGYWQLETRLTRPFNLSMHEIRAIAAKAGEYEFKTDMHTVEYNEGSIQAKTVEMSFFNNGANRSVIVNFDLEHMKASQPSYPFQGATDFVFTTDLTNNSPEVVDTCVVRVFTHKHEWVELPAKYIENMDRWVAVGQFDQNHMPIGVRVEVGADISEEIDEDEIEETNVVFDEGIFNYIAVAQRVDERYPDDGVDTEAADDDVVQEPDPKNEETFSPEQAAEIVAEQVKKINFEDLVVEIEPSELMERYKDAFEKVLGDWQNKSFTIFRLPESQIDYTSFTEEPIVLAVNEEGKEIKIYTSDDGSFVITGIGKLAIGIRFTEPSLARSMRKETIDLPLTDKLKSRIADLEAAVNNVNNYIKSIDVPTRTQLADVEKDLENVETLVYNLKWLKQHDPAQAAACDKQIQEAGKLINQLKKRRYKLRTALEGVDNYISIVRALTEMTEYARYGLEDVNEWQAFIDRLLPCNGLDDPQARALSWIAQARQQAHGRNYVQACEMVYTLSSIIIWENSLDNLGQPQGIPTLSFVAQELADYMNTYATDLFLSTKAASRNQMRKMKRDRNRLINCGYTTQETIEKKWDFSLPYPVVDPIIDPSGYVYEGVSSNRLQGVTATAYWKYNFEDMYGDLQQEVVKWDAENYGQQNPLITDEQGMYQWDVPQGEWQVKFEKEGYETTYSEWLPVPPPQLDVNIAMVQTSAPEVEKARAFEAGAKTPAGVEITFSKYMMPETLNADNIFVKGVKGGTETLLTGLEFSCPDQEAAIEGSSDTYAKKVFVAVPGNLSQYDEAFVVVGAGVKSYAGTMMGRAYEQKLDIEKMLTAISTDSLLSVGYQAGTTLRIAALPSEAAAGRQVRISTASAMIATLGDEAQESMLLTLDADGQAALKVNGQLFGSTALQMELVGEDITAQTMVSVVDPKLLEQVKAPVASRQSGTAVFRGQSVTLSCESEGAVIYYTTDGSCPCDEATRKVYTAPIAINGPMTLKVMSVGYNGTESEVREYTYAIRQATTTIDLAEGWNWASHNLAEPVKKTDLADVAVKVLTQGEGSDVDAIEAMKLKAAAAGTKTLQGDQYNPMAQNIALNAGWNWIGYPIDQTMTLSDALSLLTAEEGDVIASLGEGYAQYTGGEWKGLLTELVPGKGYLYKSLSQKTFVYNTTATVNARRLRAARKAPAAVSEWQVDAHRYPSMMCITAQLFVDQQLTAPDDYTVGVFCGDECRGVGRYVDDVLFLPVYGDDTYEEPLTVIAVNNATQEQTPLVTPLTFQADALGTVTSPYQLWIGQETGISSVRATAVSGAVYDLQGRKMSADTQLRKGVYIVDGKKKTVK